MEIRRIRVKTPFASPLLTDGVLYPGSVLIESYMNEYHNFPDTQSGSFFYCTTSVFFSYYPYMGRFVDGEKQGGITYLQFSEDELLRIIDDARFRWLGGVKKFGDFSGMQINMDVYVLLRIDVEENRIR